jgi:octopine/nopaline transport system permease protein
VIDLIGFGAKGWGSVLLMAALMTVLVTLAAMLVGAVLGALVAAAKLHSNGLLRMIGQTYTTVFRGIPELLVIYLFYYGGSALVSSVGKLFGADGFISMPAFLVGALAVGVVSGAYQAEVFRGAFQSVARSELEAARAIGMPLMLRFRRIIAPQILRFALPGMGGVWQISLKDSALISVTGLVELMRASRVAASSTGQFVLFFVTGCTLYLVLTGFSNLFFSRAELRVGRTLRRS